MHKTYFGGELTPWEGHTDSNSIHFRPPGSRFIKSRLNDIQVGFNKQYKFPSSVKKIQTNNSHASSKFYKEKLTAKNNGLSFSSIQATTQRKKEKKYILNFYKLLPNKSYRKRIRTQTDIDTLDGTNLDRLQIQIFRKRSIRAKSFFI